MLPVFLMLAFKLKSSTSIPAALLVAVREVVVAVALIVPLLTIDDADVVD